MSDGVADPLILARVREAQSAIRRSLDAAESILRDESIPLQLVTGSAVLADFDLGDGIRRRAVSASILVAFGSVDQAIRAFRRAGFNLGQPIDELEIIRGAETSDLALAKGLFTDAELRRQFDRADLADGVFDAGLDPKLVAPGTGRAARPAPKSKRSKPKPRRKAR